jgi:hypothetical protein
MVVLSEKRTSSQILKWISGTALLLSCAWIYRGFFYPDPYALERYQVIGRLLLWSLRVLFPALLVASVWAFRKIRSKKIKPAYLVLWIACVVILLLVLYPIADRLFHRSTENRLRTIRIHPFLQLVPGSEQEKYSGTDKGFRILCLGGSTTEFKDGKGRDWPSRVEEKLKTSLNRKDIRVVNCGRQWYTSLHILINYETNLSRFRPNVILVMEAVNDLLVNADFCYFSGGPFREDYGHFYGPLAGLIGHRDVCGTLAGFIGQNWYHRPRRIVEHDTFPGLVSYRRNLNALIDLAQRNGTAVVLMTQPNLYSENISPAEERALYMLHMEAVGPDRQWGYRTALNGFRQYRNAVLEVAGSRKVGLIDLESRIPKTLDYFTDDIHYRDISFDRIAQTVCEELIAQKVVPGAKK